MNEIRNGVWRHYKGNRYLVLGVGSHTETEEAFVVYVPLYEHPEKGIPLRLRPVSSWEGVVFYEEVSQPRFIYEGIRPK